MLTTAHRMARATTGTMVSSVTGGMATANRVGSTPIRVDTPKAAMAAVMQVRIMETTAMNTVLIIQRRAAGAVGPTEK